MRAAYILVATALIVGVAACSSSKSTPTKSGSTPPRMMPNVTGKQLDVAEHAIQRAGVDPSKIEIIGGGTFGVVVKSNWTVCAQTPAGGSALPSAPQLTVDRSCDSSTTAAEPTSAPAQPSTSGSSTAESTAAPLTAKNSKDLASLLKVGDTCDGSVKTFAAKYAGREIEFDGSIAALSRHGKYKTRYDIGIAPGDHGASTSVGPFFQFQNVNTTTDLHYNGPVPDSIDTGTKLHIVAKVDGYNSTQCLFFLTPVSTKVR